MRFILMLLASFLFTNVTYAQPNTDFDATPTEVCVGEVVQFNDLSSSSGTITSWTWDFGDGNTSADQNPTHTYANSGDYTVILTAEDGGGAQAEVKVDYITVNPLPNPSFSADVIGGCTVPSDVSISNVQPGTGVTYDWDFGNGTTSTSGSPANVTYDSEGSFDITLEVTNTSTGCVNTVVETVNIFDFEASFSAIPTTVCLGEDVDFTDGSSPGTDQWNWDFGNGNTSTDQNPSQSYSTTGSYTVTLTATNSSNGCSDSHTEEIEVLPLPDPSFDYSPSSGCAPLEVDFTNTTGDTGGTFEWDFGDGGTHSGENPPAYTYISNGSYSVTLTQTDENGCTNAVTLTNIINVSSINAAFQADETEGCETLEVNFTNFSSSPNTEDPITSWEWDFGNGNTFDGENPPTQSYDEGVYDVTLTITTDAGCSETLTLEEYITVGIPPNVDFSWDPIQDCAKSEWQFTNLTTISVPFDEDEVEYEWDFGDDGGSSTDENPTYEYPQDTGYFDVQLIVTFRGCADTMIYESAVYVDAPIALFNVDAVYCNPVLPLEVTFNDEAFIGKETDNAEMIWEWGDGDTDVILPPGLYDNNPGEVTHTYNNLGTYTIKQVVHNYTTGCSDSIERTINISQVEALFTVSTDSICVNSAVSLADNGSNTSHPALSYSYNMGNGATLNGASINYTYNTAGTYDLSLTVTNAVGCRDTAVFEDFVVLALPEAEITPSVSAGCSPLDVEFVNSSSSISGIPIVSSEWTFENGSTQTTTNLSESTNYIFNDEGIFQTTLIVTDEFGCVSLPNIVTTELTKPTADFILPSVVCNDEEFTASNTSSDYTSSEWFINNTTETTSNDLNTSLSHQGSETDLSFTDEIKLIVTDANGCVDSLTQEVIVSTPFADFDFVFSGANTNDDGDFVCPPVFTDLTDLSNSFGTITDWDWDFGDGKFSELQDPNNTYVFAGTYSGSLIITDEFGCADTVIYEDYLTIGGPSGELEWTSLGSLCDLEFVFTPVELNGVVDIMWAMGNGDTLNSIDEFNYTYDEAGTYTPTAILINEDNCNVPYELDLITIESNILNAFFEVDPMSLNWGEPATITDFSTGGYGGIVDWSWDAGGDQFNNNGGSFEYLFNASGEVVVTLVITDAEGCQETYQVVVNVTDNLTIPNVFTPNSDGSNDVFLLIDNAYREYTVTILNRWGNVVSETFVEEDNYLWDGVNRNGQLSTEGVYFYKVNGIQRDGEPREEHGFVHLVRDNE